MAKPSINITYLIGAGASYPDVPVVKDMPKAIYSLVSKLNELSFEFNEYVEKYEKEASSFPYMNVYGNLVNGLRWLKHNSEKHQSIDTFAKKLFIQDRDDDLQTLKNVLGAFFALNRLEGDTKNKRYDSFFATMLGESITDLPPNVKIISWNYDVEFELAFSQFSGESKYYLNSLKLRSSH